jgi:hypothetical protein
MSPNPPFSPPQEMKFEGMQWYWMRCWLCRIARKFKKIIAMLSYLRCDELQVMAATKNLVIFVKTAGSEKAAYTPGFFALHDPWRLIGESVQVVVLAGRVIIRHAGQAVADHALCQGRRQRIVDRSHFVGVAGSEGLVRTAPVEIAPAALLRPLAEYEAVVGGGW